MTNKEFKAFIRKACAPILNYRNGDSRGKQRAEIAEETVEMIEMALDKAEVPEKKTAAKKK